MGDRALCGGDVLMHAQQAGREAFSQPLSAKANHAERAIHLWALSEQMLQSVMTVCTPPLNANQHPQQSCRQQPTGAGLRHGARWRCVEIVNGPWRQ